tara:strand:+ start:1001 stop:1207 length:207 start_codon:yes stop_codon:yes gene_type:complete
MSTFTAAAFPSEIWEIIVEFTTSIESLALHQENMTDILGYIKYDMEGAQDGEYVAEGEEEIEGEIILL